MDAAKIQIVEDNAAVAENVRECLEGLGYAVAAIAASGKEAIESAGRDRPDAVLMDIKLRGDMDGIEAADRINAEFDIPVLFLSAFSDRALLQRAKKTGSFGYLVKPFEERELNAMLEMTLYKARVERERRQMQARLLQMEKMEATHIMAGGIAHNFNNILFIIIGNLDLAREGLSLGADVLENIIEAENAAHRGAEMGRLMLTYLGQQMNETAPLDLSETCGNYIEQCRKNAPEGMVLETDLPDAGPVVVSNLTQIKEILNALLSNAWEAMSKAGGKVIVSVGTSELTEIEDECRFPPDWYGSGQRFACIKVTDNGKGMDADTVSHIFDPFYSEKFTGRGMGLPVVLGIVKAHKGCITVDSASGRGSVFRVFLPLASEAERA